MRVAFRVDASISIGTGHVMRCLTLADELACKGHECLFICRAHDGHLGDYIEAKGYSLTLLPGGNPVTSKASNDYDSWLSVPWSVDAEQTITSLKDGHYDWLVVDHYALDAQWEGSVAPFVGSIVAIDDLANRPHYCDILLDQNLGRLANDYSDLLKGNTKCLIGPSYALLRPEFALQRNDSLKRRSSPKLKRILVSLGGVDQNNMTGRVLSALALSELPKNSEVDIVMGANSPYLSAVRQQVQHLPYKASVEINATNMAERMYLADLSVGAAGSTTWERCCVGLPTLLIVLAANQQPLAKAVSDRGAAICIDRDHITEELIESVSKINLSTRVLKGLSRRSRDICDGLGRMRVASVMEECIS
ncbi:UDP-2,4-diacetamido-2,4,6-trideoxy-beta-L-altropyranose hydrolase [Salinibius halmophilus]|uniref:UDP-2,4-diacetamido-2,4, 6-trideoxy-beta-L-altropyranose hydrolase n=1 Tax=Salinibius halmophilus TaxID=1853216 RepID=UPI000E665E88|nr:UDP-2,4-diacetamido-2,4,6-trideoxy-beta-L-altropyranose hydrolase [Salinibius halmophilus]